MVTLLLLKVVIHHTAIHHRLHSHLEPPQPPRRRELKVPALPPPARHKRGPRHLHTSLWSSTMPSTMSTKSRCMVYCLQCTSVCACCSNLCLPYPLFSSSPSLSFSSPLFVLYVNVSSGSVQVHNACSEHTACLRAYFIMTLYVGRGQEIHRQEKATSANT